MSVAGRKRLHEANSIPKGKCPPGCACDRHSARVRSLISEANTGRKFSKESVQQGVATRKKKYPAGTFSRTAEMKEKDRLSNLGRKQSDETKRKKSESLKKTWAKHKKSIIKQRTATNMAKYGNPLGPAKNTKLERMARWTLDRSNTKYKEQHQIDCYFIDFYIPEFNLLLEMDGCYSHGCTQHHPEQQKERERTHAKTRKLREMGYNVLRIRECELESGLQKLDTLVRSCCYV